MFKKILPVGIGLVLILLIAVSVSLVKGAFDKTPTFSDADKTYVSYEDYKLTYDRLYTYMKNKYGTTELLNMVDKQIYAEEIKALDAQVKAKTGNEYDALIEYIQDEVFNNHEFAEMTSDEKEAAQKTWDDIISSLQASNILPAQIGAADKEFDNLDSTVWASVAEYYELGYVRTQWAKEEYWKRYLEKREDGLTFDWTNAEDADNSIEAYYEANYKGAAIGFFVPFTSEASALAMMEKHGININKNVLSDNNGWVSSNYDYYQKEKVEDSDKLTYNQVVEAFIKMYNEVFAYQNNGLDILNATSFREEIKDAQTAYLVSNKVKNAFTEKKYGVSIDLPTEVEVVDKDSQVVGKATVAWSVSNTKYGTMSDDGKTVKADFSSVSGTEDSIALTLNYTVKFNDETATNSVKVELEGQINPDDPKAGFINKDGAVTAVTVANVTAFTSYVLNDAMYKDANGNPVEDPDFRFYWTEAAATSINSSLTSYLSYASTKLTISNNPDNLYSSYTNEPVKIGDYYYLILKLENVKAPELFEKDADGKNVKNDDAKAPYKVVNQELFDEIVAAKKEALLTDNAIDEMIYTNRYEHGLKIYDAYLEAIYEYNYTNFYETTLKLSDYNKYKTTKKTQKKVIAEFKIDGKKVQLTAEDLFAELEPKYASNAVTTFIENYILVNNEKYNTIYNPYTNKVLNSTSFKNLMTSEISSLKKNFEAGYFTYSYLSYYGFTPNFPAKYGWSKFIKDYFVAYSDEELLTMSTYGGSIYTNALNQLTDDCYSTQDVIGKMTEAYNKYYSTSVVNLLVTIDTDYNSDSSSDSNAQNILAEKDNWTAEQKDLAKELTNLFYEVSTQTGEAGLANQMNALVTLYKEAEYDYVEADWNTAKATNASIYDYNYFGKYKLAGLNISFETANTYDSSSSILEEFADVCRTIWTDLVAAGKADGSTLDVPVVSEPFFTDYGCHKIAVLSANEATAIPSAEEVELHRAFAKVTAAQSAIDETNKQIAEYKEKGYAIQSYEAQLKTQNEELAKAKEELNAVLKQYNKAEDYELDADAQARIKAWYEAAEKALEEGTLVTRYYIAEIQAHQVKFADAQSNTAQTYATFLQLLLEACDKADAE